MNFETLKAGFRQYLEDTARPSQKKKIEKLDDCNTSIFMYADKFKAYIKEELNCDSSILYESIEDILNMQIVDGELVDTDELAKEDPSKAKEAKEQGETIGEQEAASKKPVKEGEEAQDEAIAEDDVKSYGDENDVDMENPELLTGILNDLLQDKDFKNALDIGEDGEIDNEEMKAFFDNIKGYDDDENDISLDDILGAVEDIKKGDFEMKTAEELEEAKEKDKKEDSKVEEQKAANSASTNAAGGGGGVSGGGGVGGVGGGGASSAVAEKPKYDENGNAILENMNVEDLEKELAASKDKVTEKQGAVDTAKSEKESGLKELEQEAQDAYDAFTEQMDDETKKEIDTAKQNVDTKQQALDKCNEDITTTQENYDNLSANVDNLKSSITAYEAQKGALNTSLSKAEGDAKSDVQAKMKAIEQKISDLNKKLTEADKKAKEAKAKLDELNTNKPKLEKELEEAKNELNTVEDKIVKEHPELKELREKYDTAKEKVETERANYDKKIEEAQTELKSAQDHVREVEAALNATKATEDIKKNYSTGSNEEIIEMAKSFLGCNEADGSADKFLGGASSSSTPWCAAFVSYVLKQNGVDTGGTWAVSGLLDWGQKNGTFISKADSNSNTVKPGDVVIWKENGRSHTGLVTSIAEDGTYTTIEGNTSNRVGERSYNINTDNTLTGFISINS